jgi:RNA polymerase sigma-70 factor (ECF subfamily)
MRPSTEIDEKELIAAVLRKDRKASGEFVARYADTVYSYVLHRLLPRRDLVDDLVQDVFLAAWESLPSFRGESPVRSWLLGIARHRVEDYYRSRLREPLAEDADAAEQADPAAELRLEVALDRERLCRKTKEVLSSLPDIYGIALLWRYWERRNTKEMAAETGRSEKAIERILARARALFKERWNRDQSY